MVEDIFDEDPARDVRDEQTYEMSTDRMVVRLHPGGLLDIEGPDGIAIVRGAVADALVDTGETVSFATSDCPRAVWSRPAEEAASAAPYFAATVVSRVACRTDAGELTWTVWVDPTHETVLTSVAFAADVDATVLRLSPFVVEGDGAGLFVGSDVSRTRVLDNGSYVVNDVNVDLHYPDEPRDLLLSAALPIPVRGHVASNWSHAIADLDGGQSWVAGALVVERAVPTLGTTLLPGAAAVDGERTGYGGFYADLTYQFDGKPVAAGESLASEVIYVDPLGPDPLVALERFADAMAAWQGVTVWTERDGGRPVPNGWNSWTGSGGTGGLGTNIDAEIMRENLAVMAREFAPFGVDYFQIDDGYMIDEGDWTANLDRFPEGMAAFADEIEAAGLLPGFWISAFLAGTASQLAADHPDWLLGPEDNATFGLFSPGDDLRAIDLTNEDAMTWLEDTFRRYVEDWGARWIKLDFGYFAAIHRPRADPTMTSMELYRRAIERLDAVLGDDVFFMGIGMVGVNLGVVDTMRLTLDNGPLWEEGDPFAQFGDGNNLKNAVRIGSRRYFYHGRVWLSHDDLLFFRTDSGNPDQPLTMEEATTFASWIALSGAIVKFGEDLRTLTPEQIDVWRRLLPSYPAGARPLDLFTRHYPETYLLPVTAPGGQAWTVVGLFNWGRNYDYSGDARAGMPDEARTYEIDLETLGLNPADSFVVSEMWSEAFVGVVDDGVLRHTVAPHGHAVLALRSIADHPQFLGHNRHVTQGATDLLSEEWDGVASTLTVTIDADAGGPDAVPFEYRVRVLVPDGYGLRGYEGPGETEVDGDVVVVRWTPSEAGPVDLVLRF